MLVHSSCSLPSICNLALVGPLPPMSSTRSHITLVISNLHCPSCVDKITSLLSPYTASVTGGGMAADIPSGSAGSSAGVVSDVSISLLSHTVSFILTPPKRSSIKGALFTRATVDEDHRAGRKILNEIVRRLTEIGGFDVQGLVDPYHRVPITTPADAERGIGLRLGGTSRPTQMPLSWLTRLFRDESGPSNQERFARHLENCSACQANLVAQELVVVNKPDGQSDGQNGDADDSTTRPERVKEAVFAVEGMTCA